MSEVSSSTLGLYRSYLAERGVSAWVSYLNVSVLVGTLSLALFNASKDQVAKNMAYAYAVISVGTLVSNLLIVPHHALIMEIRKRRFMDTRSTSVVLP